MKVNKKHKIFLLPLAGFILLVGLVAIWFRSGYMMASGESGLLFHAIDNLLHLFGQTWFTGAIGYSGNGTPLIDIPLFIFIRFAHYFYVPYTVLQATVFFLLQFTGFISVYAIAYTLLSKNSLRRRAFISFCSACFYIFNQVNIVLVLNRFQYPFLFFYALMPLGLLITLIAIKKKQLTFAFILPLVTFFFATSFAEISSLVVFWVVLILFAVFNFFFYEKTKQCFIFICKFFFISLIAWVFINSWWILPLIITLLNSTYVTQVSYSTNGNLGVLILISKDLGNLSYVFRLMHRDFYQWMALPWGGYYQNSIIILLSFLPPICAFGSLLIKKKFSHYYFFIFMSLIGLFLVKGISDPVGGIFYFLFTHFRFLEAFRNPFEKIGLILPLFYAIPFSIGVFGFYDYLKNKLSSGFAGISVFLIIVACFVFLVFPIWNGWIFTGSTPPANNLQIGFKVNVPSYYGTANNWLNGQGSDYRVIALPMGNETITYAWQYGYGGVELSNGLFDKSFISYCTTIQFLCELTNEMQPLLLQHPDDFWKILSPLDTKYIMVRKDTNYVYDQMQNPSDIENKINAAQNIHLEKTFGPLAFYSGNSLYKTNKIFAATQGIFVAGAQSFVNVVPLADYKKNDIYFTDTNTSLQTSGQTHQIIVQANEFLPQKLNVSKENAIAELPYVHNLPGSPLYAITRLIENIDDFMSGSANFPVKLEESDKRIVEVSKLLKLGKNKLADETMKDYLNLLNYFSDKYSNFSETKYKEDMLKQYYVLTSIINSKKDQSLIYLTADNQLHKILVNIDLVTYLPVDQSKYRSYKIIVPEDGQYKLLLSTQGFSTYYKSNILNGTIDASAKFISDIANDSYSNLGTFPFTKGDHQVDMEIPQSFNLINDNSLNIATPKANNGVGYVNKTYSIPVQSFDPFASYILSFDYKITSGNPFQLSFHEDTDSVVDNKLIPHYGFTTDYDGKNNHWYHFEQEITPRQISHSGNINFFVYPGANCIKASDPSSVKKCEVDSYRKQFEVVSSAEIINLTLKRYDIGSLYLEEDKSIAAQYVSPKITSLEQNPARYIISVTGAKSPYYLSFLEAYHPLWQLSVIDKNGKHPIDQSNHLFINSYANAWKINKLGSYQLLLEFAPQQLFELGTKISILSFIVLILMLVAYCLRVIIRKK